MISNDKFPTFFRIGRTLRRVAGAITSPMWRFVRRWFKPVIFTSVSVVTVIALFVAEENYRSGKTWEKYQADARARGEKLTLAELAPPLVPDDQNFAMTPLLKPFFSNPKYSIRERLELPNPDNDSSLVDAEGSPVSIDLNLGNWAAGMPNNIIEWGKSIHQPDVLKLLKKYETDMTEISAASRRPYSRFPAQYAKEPPILIMLPQLGTMMGLSKLFELRAEAELDAGQGDRALDDATTAFRLSRAMDGELALVCALTEQAQLRMSLQIVWEGLATNRWSDSQMAALQKEMQSMDLFPQFVRSLQGERAFYLGTLNWMKTQSSLERWNFWKKLRLGDNQWFGAELAAMPDFAMNRAQTEMMDFYKQYLFGAINTAQRRIDPQILKAGDKFFAREIKNRSAWLHPQVIVEDTLIPTLGGVLKTYAKGETGLDEAIIACALERFKLAHGDYPAKLDELVPQFIEKLPHDVVNGEPLHYQRAPDGRFMLYSVGWDEKDDHGVSVDYSTREESGGDWVWQYSPAKIWGH